jgi:predicted transcriptional regulator of viral defense system
MGSNPPLKNGASLKICRRFVTAMGTNPPLENGASLKICRRFVTLTNMSRTPLLGRFCALTNRVAVIRSSEMKKHGIHRQTLKRAVDRGVVRKIARGLYVRPGFPFDFEHRIILACQCVPHGIVCLESALRLNGIVSTESDLIWMAIDHKARKPALTGLNIRFVRFSGQALTQGVLNTRMHGEVVRVYSVAKTVADCLKYRRKLETELLTKAIDEALHQTRCTRERLLHFARICRVEKLLQVATKGSSRI